jgi:NAD(P)-dependent dehydrogenase (short-subunit alcohol dehydrogenase family)
MSATFPTHPAPALFDLTGRAAIVTGGSKGLGLSIAAGLASAGADVALVSRNEREATEAANAVAAAFGKRAIGIAADVTDPVAVDALVHRVVGEFGRVDVLVNNAGVNVRGPIESITYEQFQYVQKVNTDGVWLASRAVVPHMKAQKSGRIVTVSSALGVAGMPDRTPYCTSKGAVAQMTRALAVELAPFGVNVNAVLPGPFLTAMNEAVKDDPQFLKYIVGATAFGRWAEMHEIQGPVLFLASAASSYVTGALLPVDGGWTAR